MTTHIKHIEQSEKCAYNVKVSSQRTHQTATCSKHVMRGGKHCAEFKLQNYEEVGVIRPIPGWDRKDLRGFDPSDCSEKNAMELRAEQTKRWGTSVTGIVAHLI